mmetsp:Transcript_105314/g.198341  ORF Transcript_105314/g.198341 Transcript_105314/m.198341 type:complete len:194 (+) Transcript_105314:141-722(+)
MSLSSTCALLCLFYPVAGKETVAGAREDAETLVMAFDLDSNRKLDSKEFQQLSHKLGTPGGMSTEKAFHVLDADGDGGVSGREIAAFVQGGPLEQALHKLLKLRGPLGARKVANTMMKKFDTDGSGFLEISEIETFAKKSGLSHHDAKLGIRHLDLDHDGRLSGHEVLDFLVKRSVNRSGDLAKLQMLLRDNL